MAEEKQKLGEKEHGEANLQEFRWRNPLLLVVLFLNILSMGAIGFFQYQAHQREKNRLSVHDIVQATMMNKDSVLGQESGVIEDKLGGKGSDNDGILLPLNGFTANLAQDDGPRRFIRLNAVLKFSFDSEESEFRSRRPQIRDSIISILNSKKPNDLLKKEGKDYLKEEIKSSINSFLVDGRVVDIYYVGFQIN